MYIYALATLAHYLSEQTAQKFLSGLDLITYLESNLPLAEISKEFGTSNKMQKEKVTLWAGSSAIDSTQLGHQRTKVFWHIIKKWKWIGNFSFLFSAKTRSVLSKVNCRWFGPKWHGGDSQRVTSFELIIFVIWIHI